jgi:hypothetical protein
LQENVLLLLMMMMTTIMVQAMGQSMNVKQHLKQPVSHQAGVIAVEKRREGAPGGCRTACWQHEAGNQTGRACGAAP